MKLENADPETSSKEPTARLSLLEIASQAVSNTISENPYTSAAVATLAGGTALALSRGENKRRLYQGSNP